MYKSQTLYQMLFAGAFDVLIDLRIEVKQSVITVFMSVLGVNVV